MKQIVVSASPPSNPELIYEPKTSRSHDSTPRLQSSSFLAMTYFLLRDYNIQPEKELPWSLRVERAPKSGYTQPLPGPSMYNTRGSSANIMRTLGFYIGNDTNMFWAEHSSF